MNCNKMADLEIDKAIARHVLGIEIDDPLPFSSDIKLAWDEVLPSITDPMESLDGIWLVDSSRAARWICEAALGPY